MTSTSDTDMLEQIDKHLAAPSQAWLLGAGISKDACIPLMFPLTRQVRSLSRGKAYFGLVEALMAELPSDSHVEHLLSQIGDYIALANRTKSKTVRIGGKDYKLEDLDQAHVGVVALIVETIRWGYVEAAGSEPERVGSRDKCIVDVSGHREFAIALFGLRAGREDRRKPIHLFTTNYDTLIEDALAFNGIPYWDGFTGGAVAYRSHRFGQDPDLAEYRAHVLKLHGSIDWHLEADGRVLRVRDGDMYPGKMRRALIYPQATKYVATQRDPFASQFDLFRRAFSGASDDTLIVCGYSFGDDHINHEIELAMARPGSRQTTLLAFCWENTALPGALEKWRHSEWGSRVYVLTQKGIHCGKKGPLHPPTSCPEHMWWTFKGVTELLRDGAVRIAA